MTTHEAPTSAQGDATGAARGRLAARRLGDPTMVAVLFAMALAVPAPGAPTGTAWWDVVLRAGFAATFVIAAAAGSTRPLIAAAALAALFVGPTPWLAVALAGFGLALAAHYGRWRRGDLAAIAAALTVQVLLRLDAVGFFGLPSLLAAGAVLGVLASAYRAAPDDARRRLRVVAGGLTFAVTALLVVFAFQAVTIRAHADAGVAAARRGLDAARAGETARLTVELDQAQTRLQAADSALRFPLFKPLLLVPVVAQHYRAVGTAAEQGAIVAAEAAAAADEANLDQLQLRQGAFDLDLLAAMAPRLEATAVSLEHAVTSIERDRSGWILAPVDRRLGELVDEVVDVLPEARLSADAARVLPAMLGAERERRYLVLFGSPGESRELGGFVGGYALLAIADGDLELVEAGSINDLQLLAQQGALDHPDGYPVEYLEADPVTYPQNLTASPNVQLVARAARDLFPELAGAPIDGVIYADPYALGAMTEFTGPVPVEGIDQPLDVESLPQFIFDGQYRAFSGRTERFDAMGSLAASVARAFERADLPGPERLGEVMGPVVRAGRLQVVTYADDENEFLSRVLLQRHFAAPGEADAFAVIQTNGTASKLDLYLHREIGYDVTVNDDGGLDATVDIELRSEIGDDVPPLTLGETDGTNRVLLSLYSPHELVSVTVDGRAHEHVTQREFGFFRHALFGIDLAPNATASVHFVLAGTAPPGDYRLGVWAQPLVHPDVVRITYREPGRQAVSEQRLLAENWLFAGAEPAVP